MSLWLPGLANPAPIIQTFFLEEELSEGLRLDGVVTVTDAKHVARHFEAQKPDGVVNEAVEQIAFADRIIVNKVRAGRLTALHPCHRVPVQQQLLEAQRSHSYATKL